MFAILSVHLIFERILYKIWRPCKGLPAASGSVQIKWIMWSKSLKPFAPEKTLQVIHIATHWDQVGYTSDVITRDLIGSSEVSNMCMWQGGVNWTMNPILSDQCMKVNYFIVRQSKWLIWEKSVLHIILHVWELLTLLGTILWGSQIWRSSTLASPWWGYPNHASQVGSEYIYIVLADYSVSVTAPWRDLTCCVLYSYSVHMNGHNYWLFKLHLNLHVHTSACIVFCFI